MEKNYLAPGVSYDKYLKAYGCSAQKGHFPYEYIDDLQKLEEHSLPPQAAFFSRLKNEGISDTDYALCQEAWHSKRMTKIYIISSKTTSSVDRRQNFYSQYDSRYVGCHWLIKPATLIGRNASLWLRSHHKCFVAYAVCAH